jgi:pimeloyl-ACP methyl ester carboxylesterase
VKVRLNDIEVNFEDSGSGPAVVLIHGLAEDRRSWRDVQNHLQNFHTFAYDLRGHGLTPIGESDGTVEQLGRDLISFLEQVTGPAACVGYSLGGLIVLWVAARRPDLLLHPVVIGTSSIVGRAAAEFFHQRIDMIETDPEGFAAALKNDTAAQLVTENGDLDRLTAIRLEAVGKGAGYINAAKAMIRLREHPLTSVFEQIEGPVEVIGADGDVFCPKKAAEILCAGLRQPHYREIAEAGHLMSIDQPDLYAQTIQSALSRR